MGFYPRHRLLELIVILFLVGNSFCWWPFSSEPAAVDPQAQVGQAEEEEKVQQAPAKFEVSNAEQKFLSEAHSYLNLSPLEKCQHSVSLTPRPRV